MSGRKTKISGLLKRYQFIDLAIAVSTDRKLREEHLRQYVDSVGAFSSYKPFRNAISGIYGVSLGLDLSSKVNWPQIEAAVRRSCKGKDVEMNLGAAKALYELVNDYDSGAAYFIDERSLQLGPDRACRFHMEHYLVRDEELIFQFPYPRRNRLSHVELVTMMSLVQLAYATGDFADAHIEIADLSPERSYVYRDGIRVRSERQPRVVRLQKDEAIPLAQLQADIQDVYALLMKLADE